jgi:hypothetical protein
MIRAIVREEIERAASQRALPDVYTTAPGGTHPGSRRWFLEHVRSMPGARRSGGKRGRGVVWSIARADFESWAKSDAFHSGSDRDVKPSNVVDIDALIRAGGYRSTRSA